VAGLGGWAVQIVHLVATPDHHDGTWIRVTQYGSWVADVRSVAELERYFPLALLEETLGRSCRSSSACWVQSLVLQTGLHVVRAGLARQILDRLLPPSA